MSVQQSLSLCVNHVSLFHKLWCIHANTNLACHVDVIKWKYFPRNWPFVRGIHRSPVNYPHKDQWRGSLMFSLICVWINGWVNNRETGDLRRHRAHYDIVMVCICSSLPYLVGLNVEFMVSKFRFDQHTRCIVGHWSHVNFINPIVSYIIKKRQCKCITNIEPIYIWNKNGIGLNTWLAEQYRWLLIISNALIITFNLQPEYAGHFIESLLCG